MCGTRHWRSRTGDGSRMRPFGHRRARSLGRRGHRFVGMRLRAMGRRQVFRWPAVVLTALVRALNRAYCGGGWAPAGCAVGCAGQPAGGCTGETSSRSQSGARRTFAGRGVAVSVESAVRSTGGVRFVRVASLIRTARGADRRTPRRVRGDGEVAGGGFGRTLGCFGGLVSDISGAVRGRVRRAELCGIRSGASGRPETLLGNLLDEKGLRNGLHGSYCPSARLAQSGTERTDSVERTNRFRHRTWV